MTWGWLKPKMNESTVYILFCPYVCQQEAARWTVRATSHRVDPPTFPSPHLEGSLPSFIHTKSHTRTVLTRLGLFLHSLFGDHISSLPHMQCEAACHCSICVLLPLSIWVTEPWQPAEMIEARYQDFAQTCSPHHSLRRSVKPGDGRRRPEATGE